MGYTTIFNGSINIEPPLNAAEVVFLTAFSRSRRMDREKGPYYVDGSDGLGQGRDPDIRDYNRSPEGQPGLWCNWIPSQDGTAIMWDGGEKFYHGSEWMKYLIEHFIGANPIAKPQLPFLQGHVCNGEIEAEGEESNDHWKLIVSNNVVSVARGNIIYGNPTPV